MLNPNQDWGKKENPSSSADSHRRLPAVRSTNLALHHGGAAAPFTLPVRRSRGEDETARRSQEVERQRTALRACIHSFMGQIDEASRADSGPDRHHVQVASVDVQVCKTGKENHSRGLIVRFRPGCIV